MVDFAPVPLEQKDGVPNAFFKPVPVSILPDVPAEGEYILTAVDGELIWEEA